MAAITLQNIPPLSTILLRVMQFDPDRPESGIQQMEALIQPDKGVSARLLKVANSSFYGRSGKIKTLREAITLLGIRAVKNLVVMLTTQGMSAQLKDPIYRKYLQEYPVLTALVAMDVCGPADRRNQAEVAFLCALLNSIGMSVIAINRPDHYSVLLSSSEQSARMNLLDLERQSYRTDHGVVGLMVCEAWKLPEDFTAAIEHRNDPAAKLSVQPDIVRLVALADAIARRLLLIPEPDGSQGKETALADSLGIAPDKMDVFHGDYFAGLKEHPFYEQATGG